MRSVRDFVRDDLRRKLLEDVKSSRIFNEADLQYRAAYHLDKEYYPELYLTNQPMIPIGLTRGTTAAKPDIVVYHDVDGPRNAFELKCFLKTHNCAPSLIVNSVWRDLDKLRKFKSRYPNSRNAFALVFVNLEKSLDVEIRLEFSRSQREAWMKHYLFIYVENVFCDESARKRNWYNTWQDEMNRWKQFFAGE